MRPGLLPNLGLVVEGRLAEIGVHTADELRAMGSLAAFARLRFVHGTRVTLVALYALDGAISGHDRRALPEGRREELRSEAAALGVGAVRQRRSRKNALRISPASTSPMPE